MLALTEAQIKRSLAVLVSFHIIIIAVSNYLVQIPLQVFGLDATWGAFSFPFVYLATDLTVRIFGSSEARKIIFGAMLPALVISYVVSVLYYEGKFQGFEQLGLFNLFVFRIAFASFIAYVIGQLSDVKVFSRLRNKGRWWLAPAGSTIVGNLLDTVIFYGVAFYASSDSFMAANWPALAAFDYGFKLVVSLVLFLPMYGIFLRYLTDRLLAQSTNSSAGHQLG